MNNAQKASERYNINKKNNPVRLRGNKRPVKFVYRDENVSEDSFRNVHMFLHWQTHCDKIMLTICVRKKKGKTWGNSRAVPASRGKRRICRGLGKGGDAALNRRKQSCPDVSQSRFESTYRVATDYISG